MTLKKHHPTPLYASLMELDEVAFKFVSGSGKDANNLPNPSVYRVYTDTTNIPSDVASGSMLLTYGDPHNHTTGNFKCQMILGDGFIYERVYIGNSWTVWSKYFENDRGITESITIAANANNYKQISFRRTFPTAPVVVCALTDINYRAIALSTMNVTTTGATIYCQNNSGQSVTFKVAWIAMP